MLGFPLEKLRSIGVAGHPSKTKLLSTYGVDTLTFVKVAGPCLM